MSPIGRIFIVLNLVLAAAFLGWAANALATTDDYRAQLDAEKAAHAATRNDLESQISDLNVENNSLQDDARSVREQRDQKDAEAKNLATQLAEAKRANEQMQGNLTKISATLNDYNDTINKITSEKDAAVAAQHEAENERDDAVASAQEAQQKQRDAEDAKREADQRIADLEAARADLQDKVASLDTRLAMMQEITGITTQELLAPPKIDAQILDVRLDLAPGLVMLNVGKAQGVKRGYTFEIWRGGIYKGQVRVADVQDNVCSALVLNAVAGTTITQGDLASTML